MKAIGDKRFGEERMVSLVLFVPLDNSPLLEITVLLEMVPGADFLPP